MAELKIKSESSPVRCEICHQSDLFDPISNKCQRCNDICLPPSENIIDNDTYLPPPESTITTPSPGLPSNPHRYKVLINFTLSGLIGGMIFNYIIHLQSIAPFSFWFNTHRTTGTPSLSYWLFAGLCFQLITSLSLGLSIKQKWVSIKVDKIFFRYWYAILFAQIALFYADHFLFVVPFFILVFTLFCHSWVIGVIFVGILRIITRQWMPIIGATTILFGTVFEAGLFIIEKFLTFGNIKINAFHPGCGAFYSFLFGLWILLANNMQTSTIVETPSVVSRN